MTDSRSPSLDIVVANYNNGHYLTDLVNSVLNQTSHSWELYIIDDCSTDNSKEIILQLAQNHKIHPIFNSKNVGVCATFHRGIAAGTSQHIGLMGADDTLPPNAVERMLSFFSNRPRTVMVYSQCTACDINMRPLHRWPATEKLNSKEHITNQLHKIFNFICFSRTAYDKTPGLDQTLRRAMDHDLTLKLWEQGDIDFLEEELYNYRCHEKGISQGQSGLIAAQYSLLAQIKSTARPSKTPMPNQLKRQKLHLYHTRSCRINYSCESVPLVIHALKSLLFINSIGNLKESLVALRKLIFS